MLNLHISIVIITWLICYNRLIKSGGKDILFNKIILKVKNNVRWYSNKVSIYFNNSYWTYYKCLKIIHFSNKGLILYKINKKIINLKKIKTGVSLSFNKNNNYSLPFETQNLIFDFFKIYSNNYTLFEDTFQITLTKRDKKILKKLSNLIEIYLIEVSNAVNVYPMTIKYCDIESINYLNEYSQTKLKLIENSFDIKQNKSAIIDLIIPIDYFHSHYYGTCLHHIWLKQIYNIQEIKKSKINYYILVISLFSAMISILSFFKISL